MLWLTNWQSERSSFNILLLKAVILALSNSMELDLAKRGGGEPLNHLFELLTQKNSRTKIGFSPSSIHKSHNSLLFWVHQWNKKNCNETKLLLLTVYSSLICNSKLCLCGYLWANLVCYQNCAGVIFGTPTSSNLKSHSFLSLQIDAAMQMSILRVRSVRNVNLLLLSTSHIHHNSLKDGYVPHDQR